MITNELLPRTREGHADSACRRITMRAVRAAWWCATVFLLVIVTAPMVEAQVLARNTSEDTTYCIEVTITATDRDGLSLSTAVAEPTTGDGTLGPGRTANFNASFDDLTQQEIDEELDSYYAFVTHQEDC